MTTAITAVTGIDEFLADLGTTLKLKNASYGDSVRQAPYALAKIFVSVPVLTLMKVLFAQRIMDKLARIANDESFDNEDPYLDLAGYAVLMANIVRLERLALKQGRINDSVRSTLTGAGVFAEDPFAAVRAAAEESLERVRASGVEEVPRPHKKASGPSL
jgi:hypothetical protein